MSKLRLEIELILPEAEDADPCVERLLGAVRGRRGVTDAHLDKAGDKPRLCLHYDPTKTKPADLEVVVREAGAALARSFGHARLMLPTLRHERHAHLVEEVLAREPGVLHVAVSFGTKRASIEYDPSRVTRARIEEVAVRAGATRAGTNEPEPTKAHRGHDHAGHEHGEHGHEHEHDEHGHDEHDEHEGHGHDEHDEHEGHGHDEHEGHGHEGHGHDEHEGHGHDEHEGHGHDEHGHGAAKKKAKGGGHHGHAHGHGHSHDGPLGEHAELIFSLICGAFTIGGWVAGKLGAPPLACNIAFWIGYVFGGWFTVQEAFLAIRAKKFEIDFLMLVAAGGAGALGEWFEGALLLFLFSFGHSLEGFAMGRARKAIEALAKLVPETALLLDAAGAEREVPVADVKRGSKVRVKPHSRVPCDGIVVTGSSAVDQASITGESVPVDKVPAPDLEAALRQPERAGAEHRVFAGTINGGGALTVAVTRASTESTLARVVELVSEADSQKSPTQQFTDKFERIFVPLVLALVVALLFAGFVIDEPFSKSFYRAMAVLVAASPCALAIATPSAVLSGVARAARGGVLVKGGAHLESLGAIETFAFDKTGTLTEGKPKLTDVVPANGIERDELLRFALAVEKHSDHPLARAVVAGAADVENVPDATDVEDIIAHGAKAKIDGKVVFVGKPSLFDDGGGLPADVTGSVERLRKEGRSIMVVGEPGRVLGVLGVMDTPRESAKAVLKELLAMGVQKTLMLSGDHQSVADAVAKQVGLTEAQGNLLPEDKVRMIDALAKSSSGVAMIGDGVNDAPALAKATVGIAMGAGGSDVALETADIALMGDDLRTLPFAVGLSRACRSIIRQNLFAALGMVAFLIPATISGFAGIGWAVVLHEGSTLLVVANALRLLAYRDHRDAG